MQNKGRVMGIDFGMRHIGVALSDELRVIAKGFETINWNGVDDTWALNRIVEIINEKNVKEIVLGQPRRTDGGESESERKANAFADKLRELTDIPIHLRDERFTTVIASRYLHEANMNAKKQKKVIDQVAAEIILQEFLG